MRRIPRVVARAPIPLFKVGLGALVGKRAIMIEHIGRKSGKPRYAVLEVLSAEDDAVVVASGYGHTSQWLRNVRATPGIRLWWGRLRGAPAQALPLSADESRELLEQYRRERPGQARTVATVLGLPELTENAALPTDLGERVPLVRFRVTPSR